MKSRALSVLGACLASAFVAPAQQPEDRVSVAVQVSPPRPVVGQELRVSVRVDVVDAFLREQVIQPFRQPLDVPIQVIAPWWSGDGRIRPRSVESKDGVRIAVDGQAVRARSLGVVERGGVRFASFVVEQTFRAEAPGPVELAPTTVRLAYATRWRDDFLAGRVPEDRLDLDVAAGPAQLEVREVPTADRPAGFTGAVGRFTVEAELAPRKADVGATVRWTWTVRGVGNLDAFAAPAAPELQDFHVLGRLEERREDGRVFVFELSPLRPGLQTLPEVTFGYFDPDLGKEGGFAVARSATLELAVTGEAPAMPGEVVVGTGGDESVPRALESATPARPHPLRTATREPARAMTPRGSAALIAGIWVVAGAVWAVLFSAAAGRRRRARLLARFETGVRAGRDARDLVVELIASGLGCRPAAVLRPDIEDRLVLDGGVAEDTAAQTAAMLDACTASRHGGPEAVIDREALRALGRALATAFEARGAQP